MDRREFMKVSAAAAVGGPALTAAAQEADQTPRIRNERPTMTYRKLGRTDMVSSRLVFGCGAALAGGKAVRLLDRAFEAGINHYDVGSNIYYKGSEQAMAPFMKAHRDDIWVLSKAPAMVNAKPNEAVTAEQAKGAADRWTKLLDASLKDLDTEYMDAYYLMAANNPSLMRTEEIYQAFLDAKQAGKVGHFGISTHKNAANCLEAAIETGWYDVAMIGITPAGWYDWDTKDLLKGTPPLTELQPLLERARNAGIGLVAMKAARHLSLKGKSPDTGKPTAFDTYYDEKLMAAKLSAFQRSYVYVLEHGLDVANSDMQNFETLEENIVAAAMSHDIAPV